MATVSCCCNRSCDSLMCAAACLACSRWINASEGERKGAENVRGVLEACWALRNLACIDENRGGGSGECAYVRVGSAGQPRNGRAKRGGGRWRTGG